MLMGGGESICREGWAVVGVVGSRVSGLRLACPRVGRVGAMGSGSRVSGPRLGTHTYTLSCC